MQNKHLRFTLGKSYIFAKGNPWEIIKNVKENKCYIPELIELKCSEHHNVPVEYSKNDTTDGFIFTDANGVKYENQYPSASYGQTSTIGDHICSLFINEENNKQLLYFFDVKYLIDDMIDSKNESYTSFINNISKDFDIKFNIKVVKERHKLLASISDVKLIKGK